MTFEFGDEDTVNYGRCGRCGEPICDKSGICWACGWRQYD
jgi:uncharacterized OB-fold protein